MHERVIGPYVPEEATKPPAGAAVDAAGMVTCVSCQQALPLAKADVVGLGYRCVPCSHRAELAKLTGHGDAGSHFTASERRGLSSSGLQLAILGLPVVVAGGLMIAFTFLRSGLVVIGLGAGMVSVGLARRGAAK